MMTPSHRNINLRLTYCRESEVSDVMTSGHKCTPYRHAKPSYMSGTPYCPHTWVALPTATPSATSIRSLIANITAEVCSAAFPTIGSKIVTKNDRGMPSCLLAPCGEGCSSLVN